MEYHGKLYGKVGRRYVPLTPTSEDYDRLKSDAARLRSSLQRMKEAVTRRMVPDEPTGDDRMELLLAHTEAEWLLSDIPDSATQNGQCVDKTNAARILPSSGE